MTHRHTNDFHDGVLESSGGQTRRLIDEQTLSLSLSLSLSHSFIHSLTHPLHLGNSFRPATASHHHDHLPPITIIATVFIPLSVLGCSYLLCPTLSLYLYFLGPESSVRTGENRTFEFPRLYNARIFL